jgi:hypothetical protein
MLGLVRSWSLRGPLTGPDPVSSTTPFGRRGVRVAKQGYLAPNDHGGAGYCRSLYALALMFPPKLSSHLVVCRVLWFFAELPLCPLSPTAKQLPWSSLNH